MIKWGKDCEVRKDDVEDVVMHVYLIAILLYISYFSVTLADHWLSSILNGFCQFPSHFCHCGLYTAVCIIMKRSDFEREHISECEDFDPGIQHLVRSSCTLISKPAIHMLKFGCELLGAGVGLGAGSWWTNRRARMKSIDTKCQNLRGKRKLCNIFSCRHEVSNYKIR